MEKLNESKEIVKLEKKLGENNASHFRGMSKSELEYKLLEMANHREEIVTTQKNDTQLNDTKELLKELNAPYKEQLQQNKLKCRFIHLLLKEKSLEE